MRTAQLKPRRLTTNTLSDALWHFPNEKSFTWAHTKSLTNPDVAAQMLISGSGRSALDSGRPIFGDIWKTQTGTLAICTGDYKDFGYQQTNAYGVGFKVVSKGNMLYLKPGEYSGRFPVITMLKKVQGVEIQNGILVVQDGVRRVTREDFNHQWPVHHSISFDGASSGSETDTNTTMSLTSHAVAGANRFLLSGLGCYANDTVPAAPTATFNSVSMTLQGRSFDDGIPFVLQGYMAMMHTLVAPATGAQTVAFDVSGGGTTSTGNSSFGCVSLTGVDQSTPVGTLVGKKNSDSTEPSMTVTTAAGEMVVDFVYARCNFFTVGADQTARFNQQPGGDPDDSATMSTQDGADGGVMTQTRISPAAANWYGLAIPVKPASVAGPTLSVTANN